MKTLVLSHHDERDGCKEKAKEKENTLSVSLRERLAKSQINVEELQEFIWKHLLSAKRQVVSHKAANKFTLAVRVTRSALFREMIKLRTSFLFPIDPYYTSYHVVSEFTTP